MPGTCTLLPGVPATQLAMGLCYIVIYVVCITSEVMMDDSFEGGMNNILLNLNYIYVYKLKCR